MGDSELWWLELASGLSADGAHSFRAAFDSFREKGEEWWARAELRVAELITAIQPNPESEFRRQAVVDYITKLIQSCVNCEVVKFGSVPLKTYLPDGDIDLTVVSPNLESKRTWIDDVHNVLQKEINNPKSEFRITQVQLVVAEVKLIKIYVEKSLLVDVSFDQVGGVCTLCFLEEVLVLTSYLPVHIRGRQVDRLIGEDHLFKRSIILVKAWCYYESRLLGANCNLMSTYALETLVLYIFHLFHASLRGPLQVLYLFLEFFSSFDWDKYCVSLSGPVPFSEETERLAENFQKLALSAEGEGGKLLFTKAFLDTCERTYGFMRVNPTSTPTKFPVKSLNIIDPLRSTNNLGRSVNQGNCARIRRAFVLGARTLRGIHGSEADVCSVLDQFFKNCIERFDGSTPRPDVAGPRSWTGARMPNGVQRMGGGRRSDIARTERNKDSVSNGCVSENGDHPPQSRLNRNVLRVDPRDPTVGETSEEALGNGVSSEGGGIVSPCAVDLASGREEHSKNSAVNLTFVVGEEVAALNLRNTMIAMNVPNGDLTSHDSRHIDKELIRGDGPTSKGTPIETGSVQIVYDRFPTRSGVHEGDEASLGMFSEGTSSGDITREGLESLVHKMGRTRVSKPVTATNGNEHNTNGSTSHSSKNDSEEDEESSSQSSSSKGEASASKNITAFRVSDTKRGLLPLSSQPGNFESSRHGSLSELQGRPPDPRRSPLDVSGAESEVERPSTHSEPLKSVRNESERDFSVPVDEFMSTGNSRGFELPTVTEMSQSKMPVHKGKIHQPNGTLQGNDLASMPGHVKRKRGPGKEKRYGRAAGMVAQDGGQVSSSGVTGHNPQQSSGMTPVHQHSPRHSSADYAASGTHLKPSQSRPYPNATGPGSFRHPLANHHFDPGTSRMTGGNNSASSHSSDPHYMPSYYVPFPSGFPHLSMYSSGMNSFYKRNLFARGDGSDGVNSTSRTDEETVEPVPNDNAVDSPSHKSQSKVMPQVAVGIVERLEADGVAASTSSRRNQTAVAARNNTHGAGVPSGSSDSEFLSGDLNLHLKLLAYGRFCEDCCSPSLQYPIGYPAYSSEQLAHTHGSWEAHGRPAQLMGHPTFYPTGPGWFPILPQQVGYLPQFQPYWGHRGVELSPRPRGTGTYLPTTLRQNIKVPSGRGRGGGQNGSQHPEADKYHHQAREHENSHRFHGPHHRASMNKGEANSQGAVHGTPTSIRVVENRSTSKAERARDSYHPKHEFSRASHSLPATPSVSSPRADVPDELPQPSELAPRITTDVNLVTDPVVVRKSSSDDSSGPSAFETLSGSSEGNVGPAPLPVSEFVYSEEPEAVLDGGKKSGPQLKRSSSVGHSCDQIVQTDGLVVISDLPSTVVDVISTATTPPQRDGRQSYHMKEEDFPPLGGRRVNRGEVATGSTSSITSNGISRFISL